MFKTSNYTVGEVCKMLETANSTDEKIKILKENDSIGLRSIIRLNCEPNLVLDLPEVLPRWKRSNMPVGFGQANLKESNTYRSFYVFLKKSSPGISDQKRLNLYLSLLENLDPLDSEYMELARLKKIKVGLSIKQLNDLYGNLIKNNQNFENPVNIEEKIETAPQNISISPQNSTSSPQTTNQTIPTSLEELGKTIDDIVPPVNAIPFTRPLNKRGRKKKTKKLNKKIEVQSTPSEM